MKYKWFLERLKVMGIAIFILFLIYLTFSAIYPIREDFSPHVDEFHEMFPLPMFSVRFPLVIEFSDENIDFEDVPEGTRVIGVCYYYYNLILINKDYWENATIEQRKGLIFHEMAHCEFAADHDNSTACGTCCPKSLMNEYLPSQSCLQVYWGDYMEGLRTIYEN